MKLQSFGSVFLWTTMYIQAKLLSEVVSPYTYCTQNNMVLIVLAYF